jgi:hypothetical protein
MVCSVRLFDFIFSTGHHYNKFHSVLQAKTHQKLIHFQNCFLNIYSQTSLLYKHRQINNLVTFQLLAVPYYYVLLSFKLMYY